MALLSGCSATSRLNRDSPRLHPLSEAEKEAITKDGFELPPVLEAGKVLPAELYRGTYHRVDKQVLNDGVTNQYRIISKFGVFDVASTDMLRIRIAELETIAKLRKLSKAGVFIQSVGKGAFDIALSPLRSVQSALKIVTKPKDVLDRVSSVPEGLERAAGKIKIPGKDDKEDLKQEALTAGIPLAGPEREGSVADTDIASRYLRNKSGYSRRIKAWEKKMGVDPYSTNEVLHQELSNIAMLDTTVGIALKFAPGIYGAIPGMNVVGNINKYYGHLEKISVHEDPTSIESKNRKMIGKLSLPERTVQLFNMNPWYSPIARARLFRALVMLEGTDGVGEYLKLAMKADNEEEVIAYVRAAQYLAGMHTKGRRIKAIASVAGAFPVAITAGGEAMIVWLIADYVAWTGRVASELKKTAGAVRDKYGVERIDFRTEGAVSARAKDEMAGLGIRHRLIQQKELPPLIEVETISKKEESSFSFPGQEG